MNITNTPTTQVEQINKLSSRSSALNTPEQEQKLSQFQRKAQAK